MNCLSPALIAIWDVLMSPNGSFWSRILSMLAPTRKYPVRMASVIYQCGGAMLFIVNTPCRIVLDFMSMLMEVKSKLSR